MAYKARILLDSISPANHRLTTMEVTYPRFVHSELLTHRALSRNSSSSRAIPTRVMISNVLHDPVVPVWWGLNQSGMQARRELTGWRKWLATRVWLLARYLAVAIVLLLLALKLHKQIANRILEPWMWITVLVSATEWENFFKLRCHPDAQPELQRIAYMMRELYLNSTPQKLQWYQWHLPLVTGYDEEQLNQQFDIMGKVKICVGRMARVSYLTHDGVRDPNADVKLYGQLKDGSGGIGHLSPFEHAAFASPDQNKDQWANFVGFQQHRKAVELGIAA